MIKRHGTRITILSIGFKADGGGIKISVSCSAEDRWPPLREFSQN
nr:MAG TPA: hypothetical protein [Caudoviricetes sp.]